LPPAAPLPPAADSSAPAAPEADAAAALGTPGAAAAAGPVPAVGTPVAAGDTLNAPGYFDAAATGGGGAGALKVTSAGIFIPSMNGVYPGTKVGAS